MTDKENGNEQGDNFESFDEFDINAPHFDDNASSHDLDGDFESLPDMDDNADAIDILPDDTSESDFSFAEDTDFDSDFDEGWEEDNSNFASANKHDGDYADSYDKPQRNWLNIAVIGVLAVAVVVGGAMFFLGGNDNMPQQPVIAQNGDNPVMPASAEDSQSLAQQAISGNGASGNMQSLLDNPELLGVTVTSNERPDPEANENEIFQALNNQPVIPDQEVDDIFAALENIQTMHTQQSGRIEDLQQPRPMPQPSDNIGSSNTYDMDFLSNIDSPSVEDEEIAPRAPAIEIEQLTAPAAQMPAMPEAEESLTAALPETPAAQVTTTTVMETPSTPVAAPVQNAETDKKLEDLNERLDQFAARLDSIAAKLDDTAAPRSGNDGSSADIAAMETVISRLESKITALEKEKTSTSSAPRTAPKKDVSPAPKRATQQPAQRSVQWDLRGASPDKAYVAERGTQNLRTVSVGDSLPGIGRITAITQQSGKWVVQGSNGRITQ